MGLLTAEQEKYAKKRLIEALEHYDWNGSPEGMAFEYGYHNREWFGIAQGKWIEDDVGPLFAKEGIDIDLSIRGTRRKEDNG